MQKILQCYSIVGSAPIKIDCTSVAPISCQQQMEVNYIHCMRTQIKLQLELEDSPLQVCYHRPRKIQELKILTHHHLQNLLGISVGTFSCSPVKATSIPHSGASCRISLKRLLAAKRAFLFNLALQSYGMQQLTIITVACRYASRYTTAFSSTPFSPPGEPQEDHEVNLFCQHSDT